MSKDNVEIEIKLVTFSNEVLNDLLDLALVKKVVAGVSKHRLLESHYYDTTQRRLSKAGVVYRVRKEPEGYIATVKMEKGNSGGLSDRTEYNVPVADLVPEVASMKQYIDLTDIVADDKLEELFAVLVMRNQCNLQLTKETKVELAIDLGEIIAGDKKMPVAELELELMTGNKKDLLDFVADLSKEIPLYPEHLSKFHRGSLLLGEDLSNDSEEKAEVVAIDDKETIFAAILQQLGEISYDFTKVARLNEQKEYVNLKELCQRFESLLAVLSFFQVVFKKEEFTEHFSKICDLANKLAKTYYVFDQVEFDKSDIFKMGYDKIKKDFDADILQGKYTAVLFSVWAWLEAQNEDNSVKIDEEIITKQVEELLKELVSLIEKDVEKNLASITCLVDELVSGLSIIKGYMPKFTDLHDLLVTLQADLKVKKQQVQASKISFQVLHEISDITGIELTPEIEILTGEETLVKEKLLLFVQNCKNL